MVRTRFEIDLENRQRRTRIRRRRLLHWIEKILKELGWRRVALSVVLVNEAQIRGLHRRYLGEDRPTDVIAFGQMEGRFFPSGGMPFLGDVVVSVETAKRVGPTFGNRWDRELLLYTCHGILHLMGYRDSTPSGKARMDKKQTAVLRKALGPLWRSKRLKPLF